MSLFDALGATDKMFDKGDTVWRVRFDIVDEMTVTRTFEVSDRHSDGEKTTRYWADVDCGGGDVFGKYDMGQTHFATREEAEAAAKANMESGLFKVVRAKDIECIEFNAWEEPEPSQGRSRPLYACCALVKVGDTFCVYHTMLYCYHYMHEQKNEAEARKAYARELESVRLNTARNGGAPYHVNDPVLPESDFKPIDLYGRGDGNWASPDFARNMWMKDIEGWRK